MNPKRESISVILPFSVPILNCEISSKKSNRKQLEPDAEKKTELNFNWYKIWPYIKEDFLLIIITITSTFFLAFLNIKIPLELGLLVDDLIDCFTSSKTWIFYDFIYLLKNPMSTLIGLYVLQSFSTFVNISTLSMVTEKMASRLKINLFTSLICQDIAFYDSHQTGELMSRLNSDVQDFKVAFKIYITNGIRSLTQSIGCTISLFYISFKMTIALNIAIPLLVVIGSIIASFLKKISLICQERLADASAVADEALFGVRTVRALAIEDIKCELYNIKVSDCEFWNIKLGLGIAIFQCLAIFGLNILILCILVLGGYLMVHSEVTPGNLMSFLVASQTIQRSLIQLSLLIGQHMRIITSGSRIFEFIDMIPKIPYKGGQKLDFVNGEIHFKNVYFVYPTRKNQIIFKDLNLILKSGEITAICGHSGSGKSTLALLIERFYDVSNGEISIDGIDIRKLDQSWLKGNIIGYISQEPILFAATIKENIRYGNINASDEDIIKASRMANAHDFIQSFENGYDTLIGEKGANLSGGQKQRIAIARALVKNPKILILDEATSALDSESEKLIQESLNEIMKERTVLIIAHRLSTIVNAHNIVVLCDGKIIEKGTHNELINNKFVYYNMVQNYNYISKT